MENKKDIVTNITSFYKKYRDILLLNKNLLISGVAGFFVSALTSELYAKYDNNDFINSIITVIIIKNN